MEKEKFNLNEFNNKEIKKEIIEKLKQKIHWITTKNFSNSLYLIFRFEYKKVLYTQKIALSNHYWDDYREKYIDLKNKEIFWEINKPKKDDILDKFYVPVWKIGVENNKEIEKKFLIRKIKLIFQERKAEINAIIYFRRITRN